MRYEKGSFVVLPNKEAIKGLEPHVQAVYLWVCSYAGDDGVCFPSRTTLAKRSGCSVRSVDNALVVLEQRGLLEKTVRRDGEKNMTNLYQILIVDGGGGAGGALPSAGGARGVVQEVRTELYSVLTQPTYICEAELRGESEFSYENENEENPKTDTKRVKDKLAVYHLFSKKEQPWWRHKQQRLAALNLFDLVGVESVANGLRIMSEHQDDKYCPQASTPFEYEEKREQLKRYIKKNNI